MRNFMNTLGLLFLTWVLVACSFTDSTDEPEGHPLETYEGETSLEERIVDYPVVVRAVLNGVTSEVIEVSGYWSGEYAAALKLHLTVREYLNGSGGDNIAGVWPQGKLHGNRITAEVARMFLTFQRDAAYDDREAVFFLTLASRPFTWSAPGRRRTRLFWDRQRSQNAPTRSRPYPNC